MFVLEKDAFIKSIKKTKRLQIKKLPDNSFELKCSMKNFDNLNKTNTNEVKEMPYKEIVDMIENIDDYLKDYVKMRRHEDYVRQLKNVPSLKKAKRRLL